MNAGEIQQYAIDTIRNEFLHAGISISRIILFGSRSRNNARIDSDWDFLVCVNEELSFAQRALLVAKIQTKLAEQLISIDIIIKSEAKIVVERGNVGIVSYYALKEGVEV